MPERSTRAKLVAAVDKVFRGGSALGSLRELARAAGVTTGAVYSQFEDRNDLVVAAALERSSLLSTVRRGDFANVAVGRGDLLLEAIVVVRNDSRRSKVLRDGIVSSLDGDEERIAALAILLGVAALAAVGVAIDKEHLPSVATAAATNPR